MDFHVTTFAIRLNPDADPERFDEFMTQEVFPSIDKTATRRGQVVGLDLLRGSIVGTDHQYLWIVSGTMQGGRAADQIERIKAFGAQVSGPRDYHPVAEWPNRD
jgi:hypothetical protein